MIFSLKNKVVIITGGSSGIGRAISILFAQQGAEVHIFDLQSLLSKETISEVKQFNKSSNFHPVDITNETLVLDEINSLEKIDIRLIEASGDLYASPSQSFFKVIWPLSLPGVVSGTLLTFIPASGDYINAELLGSINDKMIGNVIQSQFIDLRDYPTASALSFTFMAVILVLVYLYISRTGTDELV